jgi:hypothetical protein
MEMMTAVETMKTAEVPSAEMVSAAEVSAAEVSAAAVAPRVCGSYGQSDSCNSCDCRDAKPFYCTHDVLLFVALLKSNGHEGRLLRRVTRM